MILPKFQSSNGQSPAKKLWSPEEYRDMEKTRPLFSQREDAMNDPSIFPRPREGSSPDARQSHCSYRRAIYGANQSSVGKGVARPPDLTTIEHVWARLSGTKAAIKE